MWRRTVNKQVACNACGLYHKLYGVSRPIEMRKDVVYPRNRFSKQSGPQTSNTSQMASNKITYNRRENALLMTDQGRLTLAHNLIQNITKRPSLPIIRQGCPPDQKIKDNIVSDTEHPNVIMLNTVGFIGHNQASSSSSNKPPESSGSSPKLNAAKESSVYNENSNGSVKIKVEGDSVSLWFKTMCSIFMYFIF